MNFPSYQLGHITLLESGEDLPEAVKPTMRQASDGRTNHEQLLWEIVESNNAKLSQQLHQSVAHLLSTLVNDLQLNDSGQQQALLTEAYEVLDDIRAASRLLYPQMLPDLGLKPSLQWLISHLVDGNDFQVTLNYHVVDKVDASLGLVLFRVCQESIANIVQHTDANRIHIEISDEQGISLVIQDNGQGFNLPDALNKKGGLFAMIQRVWNYSGTIYVITEPGEGCQIKVHFKN